MEEQFWQELWKKNEIAFHQPKANPLLVRHLPSLGLAAGARVFVPLCGKSLDLHWLLAQGFRVAGAELSQMAVEQLFDELGMRPQVTVAGALTRYAAPGITIFQGNIFELSAELVGAVDAVYDRAALVALPDPMRTQYAEHLMVVTKSAPQLLICFEYDQTLLTPPPFSIGEAEVRQRYKEVYSVELLERVEVKGGLKGICPATEAAWALR
ncbi:MAG: thiopurine S-methyltransferase [Acidobacteriaceae bacterium]